ncbi:CPBP family intramembrane glutamic endopeptidase [Cellulomonas sp. ICMP 17802]|uniref:CPBP family intramembrane glutamic endopeptidase n=1 Tax=Cellulomonas sp. ICMP 17802 TaxID=3239199 RepID=UPI00351AE47D
MASTHETRSDGAALAPAARSAARVVAAALVCGAAILIFAVHVRPLGYLPLVLGVGLGLLVDKGLGKDLALVALGQAIISTISLKADLSNAGMARFTIALGLAVVVPTLLSRRVFRDDTIHFPVRTGRRWERWQWAYLGAVAVAAYLILPAYFLGSGVWRNWPDLDGTHDIVRLFVGVNAVGIWDELFFICVVLALLRAHFPFWLANLLQAAVFVSFLWELGYRSWGPLLTIPFALIQGWIFRRTSSLSYVVAIHLTFDLVVFLVLVHAHDPHLFDIFVTGGP